MSQVVGHPSPGVRFPDLAVSYMPARHGVIPAPKIDWTTKVGNGWPKQSEDDRNTMPL